MTNSEFVKSTEAAWREKAQNEIKDKKFAEVVTRIIGKQLNVDAYAASYVCSTDELKSIQQAQRKELGWKFEDDLNVQSLKGEGSIIHSEIRDDIISEISELLFKVSQLVEDNNLTIELNLSPDYLLTIAKLRAVRFLVVRLLGAVSSRVDITFRGITDASFYKTENKHINIVRATTMAMSGIIGGCDTLCIVPFDRNDAAFSSRIAKNISLILAEESYLDKVTDPAAGSYFIENLTYDLALKSWESFVQKTN